MCGLSLKHVGSNSLYVPVVVTPLALQVRTMPVLTVAGYVGSANFHEARILAEEVVLEDPLCRLRVVALPEAEWLEYLRQLRQSLTGKACDHVASPIVTHSSLGYIGGLDELCAWAAATYGFEGAGASRSKAHFEEVAAAQLARYVHERKGKSKFAYIDFSVAEPSPAAGAWGAGRSAASPSAAGGKSASSAAAAGATSAGGARSGAGAGTGGAAGKGGSQRVIFELYEDKCPLTVANFLSLCKGDKGVSKSGVVLHYLNSPVHRAVRDAWVQFGDIVAGKGNAGESIYGPVFADECLQLKHDAPGVLAMANAGTPHTNDSQVYVALRPLPNLDGRRVVFGKVMQGLQVLQAISELPARCDRPLQPVIISGCGEYAPAYDGDAGSGDDVAAGLAAARRRARKEAARKQEAKGADGPEDGKSGAGAAGGAAGGEAEFAVAVVGLDGAGKTSVVNALKSELDELVLPTSGFELDTLTSFGGRISVYGLGGKAGIRGIWKHYYHDIHGPSGDTCLGHCLAFGFLLDLFFRLIPSLSSPLPSLAAVVFVIDATDRRRLAEAAGEWRSMQQDARVAGKPALILLNKVDHGDAAGLVTAGDVAEAFKLPANAQNIKVRACSAALEPGPRFSPQRLEALHDAFAWLAGVVKTQLPTLQRRVDADSAAKAQKDQEEKARKQAAKHAAAH